MKNLKITVLTILLTCAMVVTFARPVSKTASFEEAKVEFYKDFKSKLLTWNCVNCMGNDCSALLIVYCEVDSNGVVSVKNVKGNNASLKERVKQIMEKHPVSAAEVLHGEELSFKLRFKNYK